MHPRLSSLQYLDFTNRYARPWDKLFMALDQLHSSKNPSEIRYWYTEWNPTSYQHIQDSTFEDIWTQLYEEIKSGWSDRHEQLCGRIVKGQPFFEKLWEMEHEQKVY